MSPNVPMVKVVWLALLATSACAATNWRERVDRARTDVVAQPGPRQAATYAELLHNAFGNGAYQGRPGDFTQRAQEALAALSTSEPWAGTDAPVLVAWRGLLLRDLDRGEESWRELSRSMALRPTLLAARAVVAVWSRAGRSDQVGAICAQSAAALSDRDDLYALIRLCREGMNAVSEDAAMSWATPQVRALYEEERARREAEIQAVVQAAVAQRQREQVAVREMEICSAHCKERAFLCANHCADDGACRNNCIGANNACVEICEGRANASLGR